MSKKIHGRRYLFAEKKEILTYLSNHTYKDTCEKFGISETTLSRWKKVIKSGGKINMSKIIISLPNFWLEYLNEQIESDVWEDYSDAMLIIIRYYFESETLIRKDDLKYLENVKEIIPKLLKLNPNIDSMLLSRANKVIYKTERWGSIEGIKHLIENWKKASNGKKKEFEFQNESYYIRDISIKHLIGLKKGFGSLDPTYWKSKLNDNNKKRDLKTYLLGLKRKLIDNDVYILAKTKYPKDSNLLVTMDALKKAAIGILPATSEEPRYKPFQVSKIPKDFPRKSDADLIKIWQEEEKKSFQIKSHQSLNRLATQVNMPLNLEEKEVLDALENQLGKNIERITADPEQETSKRELWKIPWINPGMEFPAYKYPYHYIALNGNIILLSLLNLGLSVIPTGILNLKNLTYLCLNSNNITDLPKAFSNLKSLECLILNNNQFTKVPDTIIELPRLHILYMKNNKISKIPAALTDAWQARIEDPSYQGSIYSPCNLIFSGNPIDQSSLSKDQLELLTLKSSRKYSKKMYLMI